MNIRHLTATIAVAACAGIGGAAAEEALGRLFFTPEKREALDRQRALNALADQPVAEDPQLTVNGQVVRSSGKRTTWINGQSQNDDENRGGVAVRTIPGKTDRVVLDASDEPRTAVRVGETFHRSTHDVSSELGDGKIVVKRPAAK